MATPLQQEHSKYRGYRTAGIRLREEPFDENGIGEDYCESLVEPALHRFDTAHVVMLAETGLLSMDDASSILQVLNRFDGDVEKRARLNADKHAGETALIRELGEQIGGQIHLARSSGDLGATARRTVLRTGVLAVLDSMNHLRRALLDFAGKQVTLTLPAFTHGQIAQPTTGAHWALMWLQVFGRDWQRLRELWTRVNTSPAGAAILSGTDFAIDRSRVAELLGFDDISANTMDAILSHDTDTLEVASVLSILGSNIARLTEDIQSGLTDQLGYFVLPDRYFATSSIMAQKRNPEFAESNRALAVMASKVVASALACERGPTGYAMRERRMVDVDVRRFLSTTADSLSRTSQVVGDLDIDETRAKAVCRLGWAQATDLAGGLVREYGLSWRSAHQVTGIVVRLAEDRGLTQESVTADLVREAATMYLGTPVAVRDAQLTEWLDLDAFVERRTLAGGPAREPVTTEIQRQEEALVAAEQVIVDVRNKITDAEKRLFNAARNIVQSQQQAEDGATPNR